MNAKTEELIYKNVQQNVLCVLKTKIPVKEINISYAFFDSYVY